MNSILLLITGLIFAVSLQCGNRPAFRRNRRLDNRRIERSPRLKNNAEFARYKDGIVIGRNHNNRRRDNNGRRRI